MATPNTRRDAGVLREPPQPLWVSDDTWEVWRQFDLGDDLGKLLVAIANASVIGFTGKNEMPPEQMLSLRQIGLTHLRDFCLEAVEMLGDEARQLTS